MTVILLFSKIIQERKTNDHFRLYNKYFNVLEKKYFKQKDIKYLKQRDKIL